MSAWATRSRSPSFVRESPQVQPELTVHIDWPAELAGKELAALAVFRHKGFDYQPPLHWVSSTSPLRLVEQPSLSSLRRKESDMLTSRLTRFYFWRLANSIRKRNGTVEESSNRAVWSRSGVPRLAGLGSCSGAEVDGMARGCLSIGDDRRRAADQESWPVVPWRTIRSSRCRWTPLSE